MKNNDEPVPYRTHFSKNNGKPGLSEKFRKTSHAS
jgi:hypothetical protein